MIRSGDGVLARFTRDLTADARDGRLEPVRCRADEIDRVIDILLRHGKNNPALVGPAGVGKTAIVEGLAQRFVAGDVPLALRDMRVLAVDHVSLLAGTTYRGQYEARIRGLVEETSAAPDVILFVDELHNLIGQGTAIGAPMDAANMLKPALVRGDFRVIGATTSDEYDRWVRGDPALERRFQMVRVRELTAAETLEILHARRERLERHHHVLISEEAVRAAVELTDRFQLDRMRPDRAIDALDEACAHGHALARYSPAAEVLIRRRRDLARVVRLAADRAPRAHEEFTTEDDPLERFAKAGGAAFERLSAGIEAMFGSAAAELGGEPGDEDTPPGGNGDGASAADPPAPEPPPPAEELAALDAELGRLLADESVVVRGNDVARVVGLATGANVTWQE